MMFSMDWQDIIALTIVGLTATIFLWNRFRSKQSGALCAGHCGCSSKPGSSSKESILFRARKGERPEILIRARE